MHTLFLLSTSLHLDTVNVMGHYRLTFSFISSADTKDFFSLTKYTYFLHFENTVIVQHALTTRVHSLLPAIPRKAVKTFGFVCAPFM